ncbi:cation:proton antiporter [Roseicyclus persicicus]|uniref:Cation:proton antiporter n=1 Tax=Roseicyclus persicicus TaxID=2650661 RepID=A0A7X6GW30_9RHOB|nr:cation:proton antiporter [Roseibacterium persicicum]NKX43434.1 cation:proton antiporter [Roseibacterium persicicum]
MDLAPLFLTLGGLFLAGLVADVAARRTRLPRVTLLLAIGVAAGRSGFDLIPAGFDEIFGFLSIAALTLVAFLLGNALTLDKLRAHGRMILWVSWSVVAATLIVVTAGLWAIGLALPLAMILASIACATAPAAMQDILRETGIDSGFAETLRGIVAIDDAWGLIVFSLVLVAAAALSGANGHGLIALAVEDIAGAFAIGLAVGLPGAALTGRISRGEPLQAEALGLVFLTAGLCSWLGVSYLLAGLVAGAIIANFATHHERAFHEIEHVQWPFMLLFFLMAGAVLEVAQLWALGGVGVAYVVLRILARVIGGWTGGWLAGADPVERRWIGPALLPQAGVAVGMALVAAEQFPDWGPQIMSLTVGTTVAFEVIGPPITRLAVARVGVKP